MPLRLAAAASGIACLLASAVEALPQSEDANDSVKAANPAHAKATPVKVFLMMGQSNMLGEGKIGGPDPEADHNGTLYYAVTEEGKYPYLWDSSAKNVRTPASSVSSVRAASLTGRRRLATAVDRQQERAQRLRHGQRRANLSRHRPDERLHDRRPGPPRLDRAGARDRLRAGGSL